MINKFPTIQSIVNYPNPLFLVQLFNTITIDGIKFNVLYIQDIHTFKIIYHKVFYTPEKYGDAIECLTEFIQPFKMSRNLTFIFLKGSPFSNGIFLKVINSLDLNYSHYKRSETLEIYHTHKLILKGLIIIDHSNLDNLFKVWNEDGNIYILKG